MALTILHNNSFLLKLKIIIYKFKKIGSLLCKECFFNGTVVSVRDRFFPKVNYLIKDTHFTINEME